MLPNPIKALRGVGIEGMLRGFAFGPRKPVQRECDTCERQIELQRPEELLGGCDVVTSLTEWGGKDRPMVIDYTTKRRDEVYFGPSQPEPLEWMTRESWSARGDVKELCAAFGGFHSDVRAVLEACPD